METQLLTHTSYCSHISSLVPRLYCSHISSLIPRLYLHVERGNEPEYTRLHISTIPVCLQPVLQRLD